MTLHFPLQVNGKYIGEFDARRIWPDTLTDRETLGQYKVTIYTIATETEPASTWNGIVRHRVAEGAWKLVLTALLQKMVPLESGNEIASAWAAGYDACEAGEQRHNPHKKAGV